MTKITLTYSDSAWRRCKWLLGLRYGSRKGDAKLCQMAIAEAVRAEARKIVFDVDEEDDDEDNVERTIAIPHGVDASGCWVCVTDRAKRRRMTKILTREQAERASHDSGYGTGRGALYESNEALREQSARRLELVRRMLAVFDDPAMMLRAIQLVQDGRKEVEREDAK